MKNIISEEIVAQNKSFTDWRVVHNVLFFKIVYFLLLYFHTTTLPHKKMCRMVFRLKKIIIYIYNYYLPSSVPTKSPFSSEYFFLVVGQYGEKIAHKIMW